MNGIFLKFPFSKSVARVNQASDLNQNEMNQVGKHSLNRGAATMTRQQELPTRSNNTRNQRGKSLRWRILEL